jgi:hypothetical protein
LPPGVPGIHVCVEEVQMILIRHEVVDPP